MSRINNAGQLTEGHLREEVMDHMVVSNIVQEEASLPTKERPVYRRSSATLVVPFLAAVVREVSVRVVQVGDHDEPMGNQ